MFWCRGNQIHRANCQNTSSSSSAARLEGTCLPLLLWWFNNSKQVCSLRSDGSYFLLSLWETRGCIKLSAILLWSNSAFSPLCLTHSFVILWVQMCCMKKPGRTCDEMPQPHTYLTEHVAHDERPSLWLCCKWLCALKQLPTKLSRATVHLFVSLANNGFETSAVNKRWHRSVDSSWASSMLMADPVFPQWGLVSVPAPR